MSSTLQDKIKSLIIGGIIVASLAVLFLSNGGSYSVINPESISPTLYTFLNITNLIFYWLVVSYLVNKFPIYKILMIAGLLLAAMVAERYLHISENPFTIPFLILFWLGIADLILPDFFKKYKIAIFIIYGLIISYHCFLFITTPDFGGEDRRSFANLWLIPVPVFAGLWVYEQWRWLKILKADKAKAELSLLKSQINPHFFFNTLNNLYGLVIEKSDKAPDVIIKLSDMMRYTIYEGKKDLVYLKDEISYLKNYIELHKIRYRKKVEISLTHDVEEDLKVAPLLFIILLENAFKHGVEKMREHAYIRLQIKSEGKQIFFTIENNFERSEPKRKPGIGLENLKKRLEVLYPNRHNLLIETKSSTYKVQLNIQLQ